MENMDKLVEAITAEIMRRIRQEEQTKRFLVLGNDPACEIAECLQREFSAEVKPDLDTVQDYDFVVLPVADFNKLVSGRICGADANSLGESPSGADGETLDFTGRKLLHERELAEKCSARVRSIRIAKKTIVTQLAADYIKKNKIAVVRVD